MQFYVAKKPYLRDTKKKLKGDLKSRTPNYPSSVKKQFTFQKM